MDNSNLILYQKWAPDSSVWSAWAKPVLFASMVIPDTGRTYERYRLPSSIPQPEETELNIPSVSVFFNENTAVIIDLPGKQSVEEAIAFAEKGFRPVPLYNGNYGPGQMLVNVNELSTALRLGADLLEELPFTSYSPPVFMLDSNRMSGVRFPDAYDNRWSVFPQDMPSADYFKSNGIFRIIVRSQTVRNDLERVLYDYQKNGLELQGMTSSVAVPGSLTIRNRRLFPDFAYRLGVILGLTRNSTGGFGGVVPTPSESGGHG